MPKLKNSNSVPYVPTVDVVRFKSKIKRPIDLAKCWEWTGYLQRPWGYGNFRLKGQMILAHRVSAAIHGMDPTGMCVCHRCDNPRCVNPRHLYIGTDMDNMRDRELRSDMSVRNSKASRSGKLSRALSLNQAEEVRRLKRSRRITAIEIASMYRVSPSVIYGILNGKTYLS